MALSKGLAAWDEALELNGCQPFSGQDAEADANETAN